MISQQLVNEFDRCKNDPLYFYQKYWQAEKKQDYTPVQWNILMHTIGAYDMFTDGYTALAKKKPRGRVELKVMTADGSTAIVMHELVAGKFHIFDLIGGDISNKEIIAWKLHS